MRRGVPVSTGKVVATTGDVGCGREYMHGVRGNAVRGLDTQFAFQFGVGTRQLQFAGDSEDETGGSAVVAIERNFLFVDEHFPHIIQIFADDYNHGARIYIGERTVGLLWVDKTDVVDYGNTAALVIVAGGEKVACQQDGEQHKGKCIYFILKSLFEIMNV